VLYGHASSACVTDTEMAVWTHQNLLPLRVTGTPADLLAGRIPPLPGLTVDLCPRPAQRRLTWR